MFYYYGAKNLLAKHYPHPIYETIIEPFAGSAAYSCFHLFNKKELKAILCDKNEDVAITWDFLLNCSEKDILNYKVPQINDYAFDFLIKTCSVSNASAKCVKMKYTARLDRVFQIQKKRILKFLPIRSRIKFIFGEFKDLDNLKATWFIDPPYQVTKASGTVFANGDGYSKDCGAENLDFLNLADFCLGRRGQTIVCEKEGANWLPFSIFKENKTSLNKKYNEVIFTKNS